MKKFTLITLCVLAASLLWAQEVPENWTITSDGLTAVEETTPANVSDGSSAAEMTWTSTDTQKLRSDEIAVTEGSAFSISVDILDNTDAGRVRFGIGWGDDFIDWNGTYNSESIDQGTFQTMTYTGTVPVGATTAYLEVRFYDGAGWAANGDQATAVIDNVVVTLDGGANIVANGSFETWGTPVLNPNLYILTPGDGSTVNTVDLNVTFNVENFVLGTEGKVKYSVDGGADVFVTTTDAIALTSLTEASHTVTMELVDMSNVALDPAVTDATTFTVDLSAPSYTTIYDIQYTTDASGNSPSMDMAETTKGVVSAIFEDKFWIQDGAGAWNGVYVYYTTTPGPAIGDSVMVSGTIYEYHNLTEVSPVTNLTILNSGNTIAAASVLTTGAVAVEEYEGVLVNTTGICTNDDAGYGMWAINDGSGEILIDNNIYEYTPTVGNSYTVTGVVNVYDSEWKVLPRDAADVIDNGASTEPLLAITTPANSSTVYATDLSVVFTVSNFILGTDGKVAWNLNGGTDAYVTTSPISVTGLLEGANTINLELVDMSNASLTEPITATVTITVDLDGPTYTNISDIQNGSTTGVVWIKAVVSANFNGSDYGEGYFLQQGGGAWNGINVSDFSHSPSIGDSVVIAGSVFESYDFTQIVDLTSYSVIGIDGMVAAPTVVTTLGASDEQYESVLVKVTNATCDTIQNGYGEWWVNDGSGLVLCKDNGAFDFEEVLGTNYDVIGVMSYSYGKFAINYRRESDISISSGINSEIASSISVYPNPTNSILNVMTEGAETITITNLVGQTVAVISVDSEIETIDVSNFEAGVYFVKVDNSVVKVVVE